MFLESEPLANILVSTKPRTRPKTDPLANAEFVGKGDMLKGCLKKTVTIKNSL